ncbi:hypothetical protein [Pseudoteredinibacter isoporae]|uniref:Uncharacterized protein n=1 Tax=Pseudoteredinibacter isoporae TaxID=570281 RepID=A0A7X0JSV9_9GAMM|nr:hypothetical protein [Pseudoteredinibacter isoporae]MBB6521249.1 hypothetical protein [Pseudoteredinibacter isoporae]NHO86807.1 hypothetical protein [Pseudoteredinibacter isoporae]NIB24741.1 hypothetical protein [Pseudoteredinibacter isoporae]
MKTRIRAAFLCSLLLLSSLGQATDQMSDLRIVEFNNVSFGQEFDVEVFAGDRSLYLSGRSDAADTEILVQQIKDPTGKVIYSAAINGDNVSVSGNVSKDALSNVGDFALLLPANPHADSQLKPGVYEVQVISNAGTGAIRDLRAVFKQHVDTAQAVDINIMVLDRTASTRNRSMSAAFKSNLLNEVNRLLNPHQMRVGSFSIVEANEEVRTQFSAIQEENIPALCQRLSQQFGGGRALNIGLVETISSSEVQGIAGVSPGLPATVMHPSYRNSCVLMSERAYSTNVAAHAANLVHEMSHLMAIPHTTEESGQQHDSFSDTLECALARFDGRSNLGMAGRAGDKAVDDFECGRDGGADNYMFYSGVEAFMPFHMSAQQATVLKNHPLFYPVVGAQMSASWYNPQQSGHGLSVEVLNDGRAIIYWYTFDQSGAPYWIVGTGTVDGQSIATDAISVNGGFFPPAFDASKVQRVQWGKLFLDADPNDCNLATLRWESSSFGNGSLPMARLSNLAGNSCQP